MKKIFKINSIGFILINLLICYNLAISQVVVLNSGVKLYSAGKFILSNGASLIVNSSNCDLSGTVIFEGSVNQSICGAQQINFANLVLNKTGLLTLNQSIVINNKLALTSGVLRLNNFNLLIKKNATIDGNFSAASMIAADAQGKVLKEVCNIGAYYFPVGDLTGIADFSPVKIDIKSGQFSSAVISLNLKNTKHLQNSSTSNYLNRYWSIRQTGIKYLCCDLKLNYVSSDITGVESNIYGALLLSDKWNLLNKATANQITGTVNILSDVTGVNKTNTGCRIKSTQVDIVVTQNGISVNSQDNVQLRKIQIYNKAGQLVFTKILNSYANPEMALSLKSDIYIVKILTDQSIISEKFFKP